MSKFSNNGKQYIKTFLNMLQLCFIKKIPIRLRLDNVYKCKNVDLFRLDENQDTWGLK